MHFLKKIDKVAVFSFVGILTGCFASVDSEVVQFIKKVKSQKSNYVSKLPTIPKPSTFEYTAFQFRDPFVPYSAPSASVHSPLYKGGPDLNRSREPLESFPLDSLEMVGTLERDGVFFALLKNAAGLVYRVGVGNYVGQNSGKIEKINGTGISVREWLSDGKGGFSEHNVTIPLTTKLAPNKGA